MNQLKFNWTLISIIYLCIGIVYLFFVTFFLRAIFEAAYRIAELDFKDGNHYLIKERMLSNMKYFYWIAIPIFILCMLFVHQLAKQKIKFWTWTGRLALIALATIWIIYMFKNAFAFNGIID
jgi:hypothetical protein